MPFVKLDVDILRSTLWLDREARDVFITALLLAEPRQITEPMEQIQIGTLDGTGWVVPPGWYGFVPASGPGLVRLSGVPDEIGMDALRRLGEPEDESRSREFDGRRLVRVDGGFIVLNFMKYRDKDFGAAERMRLLRARKRNGVTRNTVTVTANDRHVTANSYVGREQSTEAENVGRKEAPAYLPPPVERAERALNGAVNSLQLRLGSLIAQLSEHPNSRRMVPDWSRAVTSYDRQDGTRVKGVADWRTLQSIDRLERSIADAEWWLAEMNKGVQGGTL